MTSDPVSQKITECGVLYVGEESGETGRLDAKTIRKTGVMLAI